MAYRRNSRRSDARNPFGIPTHRTQANSRRNPTNRGVIPVEITTSAGSAASTKGRGDLRSRLLVGGQGNSLVEIARNSVLEIALRTPQPHFNRVNPSKPLEFTNYHRSIAKQEIQEEDLVVAQLEPKWLRMLAPPIAKSTFLVIAILPELQ